MKLLKRMFAVFASCALVVGLASCGGGGNPIASIANLCGDNPEIEKMMRLKLVDGGDAVDCVAKNSGKLQNDGLEVKFDSKPLYIKDSKPFFGKGSFDEVIAALSELPADEGKFSYDEQVGWAVKVKFTNKSKDAIAIKSDLYSDAFSAVVSHDGTKDTSTTAELVTSIGDRSDSDLKPGESCDAVMYSFPLGLDSDNPAGKVIWTLNDDYTNHSDYYQQKPVRVVYTELNYEAR
ncbi:hypothetical protein [Bifidobacterium ruminantium]|uniref:Lipoprotein n=1 Tax=Bifidobacterium ruminantium TaxID=78346 RepID=A0A087CPI0_BIFRU|nr:hypothetical protein [Bifidobacterium ruminantium]KFI85180.1 hypothetical protein BRUM_1862 [Bifidobacterium ruminantium]